MQHILDVTLPEAEPTGAPGGDYQRIDTTPNMFGAFGARAEESLGGGLEKAGNAGIDIATQQAKQDAETHANELHSWQSDQVSDAQEKFLTLRGKDAEMALPGFKQQIDDIHNQARSQAGNPYTQRMVDTEGRRLTDAAYSQSARHAAQQKLLWDTETTVDSASSAGSRAALAAATTPGDVQINANPGVVLSLGRSDDFARSAANLKGLDGDIEAQRNRGKNVAEIIKSTVADGSQTSLQRSIEFFHSQYDRMDPGSRATIENVLRTQAATYDGQKAVDTFMGRVSTPGGFTAPPGYINRGNQVESGGNPNAATGSYRGLGQWSPALEKRYGINDSNRNDPAAQARAWTMEASENHDPLTKALGHEPTAADYYLAHQQGIGGATAHLSQPNLAAWQNMASTIEGREKGAGWAKQAIWGNMTPEMKSQFPGGVETVTSGDFARMWSQRFNQQPIQASGLLPGNGTQLPGGATPAAFTGVDRLQGAQQFAEKNKGEVVQQILNNPYLRDRPQAMNAALTYANKVYESQNADYADMERQLHVQEQQKKMISEDAENDYLKRIYAPPLNAKPLSAQEIVLDDRLTRESKDRLIKLQGDPGEKDDKTYGPGFVKAFQAVHAPEGAEGRITDANQLYPRLGPSGDLTMAGVEKLRGEIDLRKSPEGAAEAHLKKAFLDYAQAHISGEDLGMHITDPKGSQNYLRFMAYALPAYEAGRKAGKTPMELLDPKSSDYIGKPLDNPGLGFVRPMGEWFNDMITDKPGQPATGTAAKPAFDITKVKTLGDLQTAYRAGNVTKEQADQMAVVQGWATRKAAPAAAPVSQ